MLFFLTRRGHVISPRQIKQTGEAVRNAPTSPPAGHVASGEFRSRDFKHGLAQRLISGICTKYEIKYVLFCLLCTRDNAMMYIVAKEKIANN